MNRTVAMIAACMLAASGAAFAKDAHHPDEAKIPPAAAPKPAAPEMGGMGRMQEHMIKMQDQMSRMRAATEPKEKNRLMDEHMKTMEESMSMMKGMMNCAPK